MIIRPFARFVVVALSLLAVCAEPPDGAAEPAPAEPLQIAAQPVALNVHDAGQSRVGRLIYRGGINLTSDDGRFGGWSDISITPDGARLVAISDRGFWFDAEIAYDEAGWLSHLNHGRIGPLVNLGGWPMRHLAGDAEGLAAVPDGSFFVSFERRHRVWHYPPAEPPFSILPRLVPPPPGTEDMPGNGGIEAMVRLPGGRLFALAEAFYDGSYNVGWIGDGRDWQRLTYVAGPDFRPAGATLLPDGDILVLERRFTRLGMPGARLVQLAARDVRAGARLVGAELARIEPPLSLDNFEGVAARRGPGGKTFIYLMSDDNYFFLQRTLLLMFELAEAR
ncbi:MAG TPA: esterase-like activity of phytase family protein [Alphaproteobacteria bacterium]